MPGGTSPVWFMLRGEQKFGPYSHDKLKQLVDMGKVTPDDYFGCKGMERWTRGRDIPDVQALFDAKAVAPPTPPADAVPGPKFTFVVRVSDPGSGDISSTQVEASTAEQARRMVAATGMVVQGVQLKPPASQAPPQFAPHSGPRCQFCQSTIMQGGRGLMNWKEIVSAVFLLLCWFLPGVIYYLWITSKPYCPTCRQRVQAIA